MNFNFSGEDYEITRGRVVAGVNGTPPELPDKRHRYYVRLEGGNYPIKQLIANVTGLSHAEITAQDARSVLIRLNFQVDEFRPRSQRFQSSPSSLSVADPNAQEPLQFAVTVETDEDGFYVSSCPALSGCHSQGRTRDEALNNMAQAIRGYLASMQKHGETLPNEKWEVVEVTI
jgi:antitoxin HicB